MLTIIEVQTPAQIALFRELLMEYGNDCGNNSFSTLESDLRDVTARYAPPSGCRLIGLVDGVAVGCAGLAVVAGRANAGEMKRVFVRREQRGKGYGRALAAEIVACTRRAGYGRVVLSVFDSSHEAVKLYREMGFELIEPFKETPHKDLWLSQLWREIMVFVGVKQRAHRRSNPYMSPLLCPYTAIPV